MVRYGGSAGLDAIVVCWEPSAVAEVADDRALLDGVSARPTGSSPARTRTRSSTRSASSSSTASGTAPARSPPELLRHQLAVLLLRIALLPGRRRAGARTTRTSGSGCEVEEDFARTRRVEEYAERMGYSVRTVTRACLAATGRSAKQVIDDRVTLEAMRLLAVTDDPIADIGRRLGFPEPTNFGRFFHREVGTSPGAFRAGATADPGDAARLPAQRPLPAATDRPRGGRAAARSAGEA